MLLDGIVKRLIELDLFKPEYIENVYRYHGLEPVGEIVWTK